MFRRIVSLVGAYTLLIVLSAATPSVAKDLTAAETPDQVFWLTIRDTTLPDLFEMFIERYPNSSHSLEAQQRLKSLQASGQPGALEQARQLTQKASGRRTISRSVTNTGTSSVGTRAPALAAPMLAPAPVSAPAPQPEPVATSTQTAVTADIAAAPVPEEVSNDTVILIQHNLNRVGCTVGKLDGIWGRKSQSSAARFVKTVSLPLVTEVPTTELLEVLKGFEEGTCPVIYKARPRIRKKRRVRRAPTIRKIRKTRKVLHRKKTKKRKKIVKKVKKRKKIAKRSKKKVAKRVVRTTKKRSTTRKRGNDNASAAAAASVAISLLRKRRRQGGGGSNNGGGQLFSVKNNQGPSVKKKSFKKPSFRLKLKKR